MPATGQTENSLPQHPGVLAPPPLVFVTFILAGWGLEFIFPRGHITLPWLGTVAGGVLVVCGFVLIAWSAFTFRRFGTSLNPWRGVRALVVSGPYRVSRNPVYAGDVLIHAGIGLLLNNGWILVTLLPAILVMQYGVILREERYLKKRFGDRYLAYCKHVRRWL